MKQVDLIKYVSQTEGFGGSLLGNSHAKGPRPLSSKDTIHVVFRSEVARGQLSMRNRRHRDKINQLVAEQAKKWGMRIYRYANVGNHLHILLRIHSRRRFQGFLRTITGLIARLVLSAERGQPSSIKFWELRPFTRVVKWGKDYMRAKDYVDLNAREALGFLSPRRLKQLGLEPETG